MSGRSSRGRRRGPTTTREAILAAAASRFAAAGYDRASLRSIATDAGVDQKLIAHYFGSKQQLFVAAIGFPLDPAQILPTLLDSPRDELRARLVELLTLVLDETAVGERMTGIVRGAASSEEMARMIREFLARAVFEPLAAEIGGEEPLLRANLVGSQVVGLLMARNVVAIEPLASIPARRIAQAVAPTLERYLAGPV